MARLTMLKDSVGLKQLAAQPGYNVYFHISDANPATPLIMSMIPDLQADHDTINFGVGKDNEHPELAKTAAEDFGIVTIPSVVLFSSGKEVARVTGPQFPLIVKMLEEAEQGRFKEARTAIQQRCYDVVNSAPIMLLMKGSKEQPYCGFSKQMVAILNEAGIEFDGFDIFTDQEVRAEVKEMYKWPTFPQLYANGVLVGGLDVIKAIIEEGGTDGLKDEIRAAAAEGDKPWKFEDH